MFAAGFVVDARKGKTQEWGEFKTLADALAWRAAKEGDGWVCGEIVSVDVRSLIEETGGHAA